MIMHKSYRVTLPEFVKELQFLGKGIECQVYVVVKCKLVCKIYISDAEAKYCYTLQRIAYKAGIAPKPMGLEKNYYFSRFVGSYTDSKSNEFHKVKGSRDYQEFIDKVHQIFGGEWNDVHSGNIGLQIVNGKRRYFVIDFGVAGFGQTYLGYLLSQKLSVY